MKARWPALLWTVYLLTACSGSGQATGSTTEYAQEPLLTMKTQSSRLEIEVRTLPNQPPVIGASTVQLLVRDSASGEPASGLDLTVVPWMPTMGHGSSVTPSVEETEPGMYQVTGVVLFMPGTWQLRTSFDGAPTDHVAPSFQVR